MANVRKLARKRLDERLAPLMEVEKFQAPPKGWVRAMRDALGMSTLQLAKRMGVTPQAITGLEQSEALGTVRLNTLRRVAEGLDATLVYAIVPNTTLQKMVDAKAERVARAAVASVDATMRLEGQGTGPDALEEAVASYREGLRDRDLWD
jgi:predicted DNA-binding mobile mystery protein A